MKDRSLDGRVAIVTGGAVGMGKATAELFAAEGASVLIADIDEQNAEATARAIVEAGGVASWVRADVSSAADVEAMVEAAVDRYGSFDCAVNNAAAVQEATPLVDMTEAGLDRMLTVNLKSVGLCLKYQIRKMLEQDVKGTIVNVASINAVRPQPDSAAYTAAKAGVLGFTRVASLEYAPRGIRVNTVCPGGIDTPMMDAVVASLGVTKQDVAGNTSLFGRLGTPDEVAQANLWLSSDASSFVTGHTLAVDGGYLAR